MGPNTPDGLTGHWGQWLISKVFQDPLPQHHLAAGQIGKESLSWFEPGLVATEMGSPPSHAHPGLVPVIERLMYPVVKEQ